MKSPAIAIFVKTPGLSPLKTRLAASTNSPFAEEFYLKSVNITKDVVTEVTRKWPTITPYWAIAEKDGLDHPLWGNFDKIWQGEGGLGDRLANVYERLRMRHEAVILIGADCPLISSRHIEKALTLLKIRKISESHSENNFVIGPARDGGFYLFAGVSRIPSQVWTEVPYGQEQTLSKLKDRLYPLGKILEIEELSDVDTLDDLLYLPKTVMSQWTLLEIQKSFLKWIIDVNINQENGKNEKFL